MGVLETIFWGSVSGVSATVFLYLFGLLIKHHLIPFYQKIRYKGVDINGTWVTKATSSSGVHGQMEMTIKQNAHYLCGDTTIIQGVDPTKPTQVTNLSMIGNLWEGFITLNQQSKDRSRLSYSTSLLQVHNGGLRLKGIYCFRSIQSDKIESVEVTWSRKEQNKS
jgi:hypothetical protein